jgi:hypothetical protein
MGLTIGASKWTFGETYPAISSDGGLTWRIDGPLFHRAAANGAAVASDMAVTRRGMVYVWGRGGSFVWTTTDIGRHWRYVSLGSVTKAVTTGELIVVRAHGDGRRLLTYTSNRTGSVWRVSSVRR